MAQKIKISTRKYWRKKQPTRGAHEVESSIGGIWLRAATVRAIKTVAEAALAGIGTAALMSDVNWLKIASTSLLAGIISILMSIRGLPEVDMYIEEEEDNG